MTTLICDYVSLADLKAHLRTTTTADDAALAVVITAASRAIDAVCNRRFGLAPAATSRLFTYHNETLDGQPAILIDDVQTTTGLVVTVDTKLDYSYSTTLTLNSDFDLYPWNAAGDIQPWTALVLRTTCATTVPNRARSVAVTGQWGWATIPSLVEVACLIQASRWFMRRDSWAGIAGSPDLGNEVRLLEKLDPDVTASLQPLVRYWGAV